MSVCVWPIKYTTCGPTGIDQSSGPFASLSPEDIASVESRAIDLLWEWTGRVFGLCPVAIRPCKEGCDSGSYNTFDGGRPRVLRGGWNPVLLNGTWSEIWCGSCGSQCRCGLDSLKSLSLPGPVAEIERVLINGEVVPPTSYRVDFGRVLIRTDGGTWPTCQDLSLPPTSEGTFLIEYTKGIEVPEGGQVAAGELALELAKAMCNDNDCKLPQRLQTITRQGVTMGFMDSFEGLDKGRTGIWSIDAWLASVTQRRRASSVRSVDVPSGMSAVGGRAWPRT